MLKQIQATADLLQGTLATVDGLGSAESTRQSAAQIVKIGGLSSREVAMFYPYDPYDLGRLYKLYLDRAKASELFMLASKDAIRALDSLRVRCKGKPRESVLVSMLYLTLGLTSTPTPKEYRTQVLTVVECMSSAETLGLSEEVRMLLAEKTTAAVLEPLLSLLIRVENFRWDAKGITIVRHRVLHSIKLVIYDSAYAALSSQEFGSQTIAEYSKTQELLHPFDCCRKTMFLFGAHIDPLTSMISGAKTKFDVELILAIINSLDLVFSSLKSDDACALNEAYDSVTGGA